MNLHVIVATIVVFLALPASLFAASSADGKALYTSCAACHGSKGEGNRALGAPNIAGMDDWYLNRQLENFASGKRGTKPDDSYGAQMRTGSGAVNTPAKRASIVAYVAKLPKVNVKSTATGKVNLANGSTQYNALCSACHAANGKGNQTLGAPSLVAIDSIYLSRQFTKFRLGKRGYDASDMHGKQMAAISKMLNPKTEPDVFAYISNLKP